MHIRSQREGRLRPMAPGTTAARARDLYRAMDNDGGTPLVDPNHLGVRTAGEYRDIQVDTAGVVLPGTGGMSVTPDDPINLPRHFRPRSLGGRGKRPVWLVSSAHIIDPLAAREDGPTHWLIEPSSTMALAAYESGLVATAPRWSRADV